MNEALISRKLISDGLLVRLITIYQREVLGEIEFEESSVDIEKVLLEDSRVMVEGEETK